MSTLTLEQIQKTVDFVDKYGHVWFMKNYKKWNCALTIACMDINEMALTPEGCKAMMISRIIRSPYLVSKVPSIT